MKAGKPTAYRAVWYAESMVPAPPRAPLTIDLDIDVCVVGGGLAGLTTAREVARRGWSVAVLEAQRVASGASGRNCGFVLPGYAEDVDRIIARVGLQQAKALWALSERGLDYVRRTIRETKMPGVKPVDGWLSVAKFREDTTVESSVRLLRDEFGMQVEAWSADKVQGVLKSPFYRNAVHFPRAFHIHPLNYALGLAAAAEAAGARIFEYTPVLSIDPSGIRKRVITPSARVRAAHVVLAGNTGLGAVMPRLAASLLPITTYVATTVPLGPRLAEAVSYRGAVSDTPMADNHYRIVDGDRLLWAGGLTMWAGDPRRFARRLAADIRRTFPQLGKVKIDQVWAGTLGRAVHSMPQVGEFSRGLWLASGFGGHGFNTTAIAGELIARGIVEGDQTWRLFSPYDLVWAGGIAGRAAVQVIYWSRRIRDLVDARWTPRYRAAVAPQQEIKPQVQAAEASPAAAPPSAPAGAAETAIAPAEPEPSFAAEQQPAKKATRPRKRKKRRKPRAGNGAKRSSAADAEEEGGEKPASAQEIPAER
jgi:glycine/D-amino acid oxidase-like deaminating enzyme